MLTGLSLLSVGGVLLTTAPGIVSSGTRAIVLYPQWGDVIVIALNFWLLLSIVGSISWGFGFFFKALAFKRNIDKGDSLIEFYLRDTKTKKEVNV